MGGSAKPMARAALGAALNFVLLYLAQLLPTARLALLCAASVGVIFVLLCASRHWALGCYAVTTVLALLLLPGKSAAAVYALFTGYYPLVKLLWERQGRGLVRWGGKLLSFNIAFGVLVWLFSTLLAGESVLPALAWPLLWLAGNAVFLAYDFALTQIILIFLRRIKGRIK